MTLENGPSLKRVLSLPLIIFYGLGNILGAGIYVLIGRVAGHAGYNAPLAFFSAGVVAGLTALSYAELSSRYPLSSGAALYVAKGFGGRTLPLIIGILLIFVGITSAGTMTRGFIGYLGIFITTPDWPAIIILNTVLGGLAVWGIMESIRTAAVITLIEVGGLLLIIVAGALSMETVPERIPAYWPLPDPGAWKGLLLGAFLAFYAFLGFEDMVNVAEEVKDVRRNMPLAIILSLVIAALLYMAVTGICLLILEPGELAASDAPLAQVYARISGETPYLISAISLFAVVNGALIQIIMSSRVAYGMSRQGWLPAWLGIVNPVTRTPVPATVLMTVLVIVLAAGFPLETLARSTSFLLLIIFALVNLALIRVKKTSPDEEAGFRIPVLLSWLGLITCLGLMMVEILL